MDGTESDNIGGEEANRQCYLLRQVAVLDNIDATADAPSLTHTERQAGEGNGRLMGER